MIRFILLIFGFLFMQCMRSQQLTLDDSFDEDLVHPHEEPSLKAHLGFGRHADDKIIFDYHSYFQPRLWKNHNPNTIELRFGKQGTEVVLCGSTSDYFDYSFYAANIEKHPILSLKILCKNDSTGNAYDLQIGFQESKKKIFHTATFYLPQENLPHWYRLDLRDLVLQHPSFNWKKMNKLVCCVHTRKGEAAYGSFVISEIRLEREVLGHGKIKN